MTKNCNRQRAKVCLVSVLPPFRGGVPLYTLGLLAGFEKRKHKCDVVAIANTSAKEVASNFKNVRVLKTWNKGLRFPFQVLSAIIREKPVVVHFQHEFFLYGGMLSAVLFPLLLLSTRLLGIKTVVTLHGVVPRKTANNQFAQAFFIPSSFLLLQLGLVALTIMICTLANIVIVHSNFARHILNQDYRVPLRKIQVVHHGIGSWNSYEASELQKNVILFFGNLTPSKGLEQLLAAFEHVQMLDAKLIIAGGPHPRGTEYFHQITSAIQSSPKCNSIVTTGYIPDHEIHDLFQKCTVAAFPYTLAISSSGGLSLAMQHRKPVVVSSLPWFTELIVDGSNGLVVPPNDSVALAHAIERLLMDEVLRERLSRTMSRDCAHLAWPVIAEETIKSYQV